MSYGTEGRRGNPAEEIAPSASVYEYIVFRGSDVKDISISEEKSEEPKPELPQVPNDPAILGVSLESLAPPSAPSNLIYVPSLAVRPYDEISRM
jgi:protein LSM14